jgi:hypothetical protein
MDRPAGLNRRESGSRWVGCVIAPAHEPCTSLGAPQVAMPKPPRLSPLSSSVFAALSRYTAFPWPLMKARCRRHRIDASTLTPTTLGFMVQDLALGVARFNGTEAGFQARRALVTVLREHGATAGGLVADPSSRPTAS